MEPGQSQPIKIEGAEYRALCEEPKRPCYYLSAEVEELSRLVTEYIQSYPSSVINKDIAGLQRVGREAVHHISEGSQKKYRDALTILRAYKTEISWEQAAVEELKICLDVLVQTEQGMRVAELEKRERESNQCF